ncbi:MAG: sulfotransferase [Pseudomonadota bacterium]
MNCCIRNISERNQMASSNYPVVIGATGGSGTRIFAKACMCAGYYMGSLLNESLDSLHLAPFYDRWINPYVESRRAPLQEDDLELMKEDFHRCISEHRKAMQDAESPWGWKGPRTMYLLEFLDSQLHGMKFIHVVRDGRDMAYSSNQNQLIKHGQAALHERWLSASPACRSMALWNQMNFSVARYGENMMKDRYLRVRFEDLCTQPQATLTALFAFLDVAQADTAEILSRIKAPQTIGRWQSRPGQEIRELVELGRSCLESFGYMQS